LAPKASLLEAQKELDRAAVLDGNEAEVGYLDAVVGEGERDRSGAVHAVRFQDGGEAGLDLPRLPGRRQPPGHRHAVAGLSDGPSVRTVDRTLRMTNDTPPSPARQDTSAPGCTHR
jgi:hypothetical protein